MSSIAGTVMQEAAGISALLKAQAKGAPQAVEAFSRGGALLNCSFQGGGSQCAGAVRAVRGLHLRPRLAHAQAVPPEQSCRCSCRRPLWSAGD